jgi:hypothetical protein
MNNSDKYYRSFGLDRTVPRSFLQKQELNQVFAMPKKEPPKIAPHFYNFEKNFFHYLQCLSDAVTGGFNWKLSK